jgi:hypothetical protein
MTLEDMEKESNPFHIDGNNDTRNAPDIRERLLLRDELTKHLCSWFQSNSYVPEVPPANAMFESCTVQPTGALGLHQDAMNCSIMEDNTVACIIPIVTSNTDTSNKPCCLSYLFYSRKCVSDYSKKKGQWEAYLQHADKCDLTRLCLKSILHVGGVYDYQFHYVKQKSL